MPRILRLAPATPPRVGMTIPIRPPYPQHKSTIPRRTFTSSRPARAREQNFYEILDLPTSASAAEIKKYQPTACPPVSS